MSDIPRPSHADYTYQAKYGVRASSGGGRASARETIGRVAAGAIAEKWLSEKYPGLSIVAWVSSVGSIDAPRSLEDASPPLTRDQVDATIVRCPDLETSARMQSAIEHALSEQDSLGGVVTCVVHGVPAGLGEPVFDKLEALLAHAMLSIPSTKGFEIGSGFEGARMRGSKHNDMFVSHAAASSSSSAAASPDASPSSTLSSPSPSPSPSSPLLSNSHALTLRTSTNRSGGIQGGISNGEPLVMRVAFKPPATIGVAQGTADFNGAESVLRAEGRHDPCVLPRAIPIVEAMAALVIADCAMLQLAREAATSHYPVMGKIQPPTKPAEATASTLVASPSP
jgi:chorismate synthase